MNHLPKTILIINFLLISACQTNTEKHFFINHLKNTHSNAAKIIQSKIPFSTHVTIEKFDINHDGYKDFFAIMHDYNYYCDDKSCPLFAFLYIPMRKTWQPIHIFSNRPITFSNIMILKSKHQNMNNIALIDKEGNQEILCWNEVAYQHCNHDTAYNFL